ncbi:retrotransposable element ORF2 protein [Nymphaea thermarum]|nr:retrotransposable element ORF2 protein [Nymphaea thermarum]
MTVVLNSKEGNWFFPQRGVRQGDPLSPYLFLIVAEMFTRSLKHVINNKQVKLPTIGKDRSDIDSLFYADDLLMFAAYHMKSLKTIKGIFQDLENCSGLTVNKDKSIIIGINTSPIELSKAARILEWQDGQLPFKYLGVSLQNKRLVDNQCSGVLLRIGQKLGSLKNKLLSYAGRICLIRLIHSSGLITTPAQSIGNRFGRPSGCIKKLKSGDSIYGLDMDYQGLFGQSTSDAMA